MSHNSQAPMRKWLDGLGARVIRLGLTVRQSDRGDVPGWVLVSVMTAGLTTAVWLIADEQLTGILDRAMNTVSTP